MPSLLISVRDLDEFRLCLDAGVPWIDFKEPADGALAPTSPGLWRSAMALLESRRRQVRDDAKNTTSALPRLSAALGELRDQFREPTGSEEVQNRFDPGDLPEQGLDFVKLGWSFASHTEAAAIWQAWARRSAMRSCPVLVIYADHATCQAPDPEQAFRSVGEAPCGAMLIDTYEKGQGDLFSHLSDAQIQRCLDQARQRGWVSVLAGSLREAALERALALQPDVVAVRGAACRSDRRSELDPSKVRNLVTQVVGTPCSTPVP